MIVIIYIELKSITSRTRTKRDFLILNSAIIGGHIVAMASFASYAINALLIVMVQVSSVIFG